MAVYERLGKIKEFVGDSTDTKPTALVGAGHTFTETNTGLKWLWNGTSWVEDLRLIYSINTGLEFGA